MATDVGFLNKSGSRPFSVEFFRIKHELRQMQWAVTVALFSQRSDGGSRRPTGIRLGEQFFPFASLHPRLWPADGFLKLDIFCAGLMSGGNASPTGGVGCQTSA